MCIMKTNYLFPNKFKRIGWFILIPSAIIGLITLIYEYEPSFLDFNVPAIFIKFFADKKLFGIVENNILNLKLAKTDRSQDKDRYPSFCSVHVN